MNPWTLLAISICLEIVATNLLKVSDGFTKLLPTIGSLTLYAISFYFVSLVFRTLSVGLRHLVRSWHCFDGHCGVFRFWSENRYRWADWYGIDYQRCFSD